ncbi:DUF3566 domain-containing protein [Propionibacteriaceae bacterium G57]|uniref:DUF3566 domain-containing protein n=1 Tax=Aestuariimicrobium sp. G57 TaxID=3418485 RepID=UPI003DA6E0F6
MSDSTRGAGTSPGSPFSRPASEENSLYRSSGQSSAQANQSSGGQWPFGLASGATSGSAGAAERAAGGRFSAPQSSAASSSQSSAGSQAASPSGYGAAASAAGAAPARRSADSASSTKPSVSKTAAAPAASRRTRKARLRLARIDPWSVMKTALLFSIAFGILGTVAMWVIWGVIDSSGTFESINRAVNDLLSTPNSANSFDLGRYLTGSRVVGLTAVIMAADVVIFTALATLFSFLYNLSATVLGGLEVTLAED